MADPPNTTTDPAVAQIATQTGEDPAKVAAIIAAKEKYVAAQQAVNDASQDYGGILGTLHRKLQDFQVDMNGVNDLVGRQATSFGLLTAGVVQTKEMFTRLNTELRTDSLGSFTEQTRGLIDTVGHMGAVTGIASDSGKKLLGILGGMGVSGKTMAEVMTYSGEKLAQFAKSVMTGADNSLRFQSILMQGAARGGALKELYDGIGTSFGGIGSNLENLNKVTAQFQSVMMDAADATGQTGDQMAGYMATVLQSPAGIQAMAEGIEVGGQKMEALTAVTRIAQGAGMDIATTYKDINKTIYESGMNYQDATRFVARFGDVSKDLHGRTEDVQAALFKTTNAFSNFIRNGVDASKMNQSLTDSVKAYAAALEASGVPAQRAIALASQQVSQLANLNEAQESFASQATGGPGGLEGAAEMEDLIERDPMAAQQKMVEAMQQAVGGKMIGSRAEAERTGQLQQYYMQRQMLMQGTLGIKAGSRGEADQMMAAMAKGEMFKPPTEDERAKAAETAAAETMQRGEAQEKLTYTGIKEAQLTAERVMLQAGTINLGTLQKSFAAGAGEIPESGRGVNVRGREILSGAMASGAAGSGGAAPVNDMMRKLSRTMGDIPTLAQTGATSLMEQLTSQPQQAAIASAPSADQTAMAREYAMAHNVTFAQAMTDLTSGIRHDTGAPGTIPGLSTRANVPAPEYQRGTTPGRQVGAVIPGLTGGTGTGTGGTIPGRTAPTGGGAIPGLGGHVGGPVPVTIAGGNINLNLTGVCPHCKAPIQTNLQSQATNVAANGGGT